MFSARPAVVATWPGHSNAELGSCEPIVVKSYSLVTCLDGHNLLPKIIRGVKFTDGCEVIAKPGDLQSQTAAA